MGKIFGISDLPVSTIMSPFEGIKMPKAQELQVLNKTCDGADKFVSSATTGKTVKNTNNILKILKRAFKK